MKKVAVKEEKIRRKYNAESKKEALKLVEKVGVAAGAKQLGLHESQLYNWRAQAEKQGVGLGEHQQIVTENIRLKRELAEKAEELAILKKAAAYFAKSVK